MSTERAISRTTSASRPPRARLAGAAGDERQSGAAAPALDVYRRLGSRGLEPAEAGNLTAFLIGLRPVESGWEIGEIERLLFVGYLVAHGRLRP